MNGKSVAAFVFGITITAVLGLNLIVNVVGVSVTKIHQQESQSHYDWQRLQYLEKEASSLIHLGATDTKHKEMLSEISKEIEIIVFRHPEWKKQGQFR